ncbi:glycosyltransferase family 4 protein [Silvibacterium acidisoli]|uniref:glycosyltransferase family 4 protein n=1 Tax=Acidobacteriaceae bacterium ZG23-2 TaxID=2883246 RepID=UPI00406CB817
MKRPALLFVDLNRFFGGGQVYLTQLADLLKGTADLYAFCINPEVAELLKSRGVKAVSYRWAAGAGKPVHLLLCFFYCIWFRVFHGVNIIWANGIPDIVTMPLARMMGCRAFITRHLTFEIESQHWYKGLKRRSAEFLYRLFARTAHKVVCVSHAVAVDVRTIVPPEKMVVIQNWVTEIPELLPRNGRGDKVIRLLYVGRLQKYKGASSILAAMRQFSRRVPGTHLSLTIVGEGRHREELETEAEGLDVTFTGFQADPTPYYRRADVFLNPSIGPEGLPLVSLEAMSHGLSCIFSDLPVHKEITGEGKAALLFRAGDVDDLTNKLTILLTSRELLDEYGRTARAQIETQHAAPVAREKYLSLLAMTA